MTEMVFDGHNDCLLRLWKRGDHDGKSFIEGGHDHLDLPKALKGGFGGGFFAIFTPSSPRSGDILATTSAVSHQTALAATEAMIDIAHQIAAQHNDKIKLCGNAHEITSAIAQRKLAMMLHIEGAEAIAVDLSNLEAIYARGVRSIGPVWSRNNSFGCGVPFAFPASPDQGSGLTEAGIELIHACNRLRIMIDLSHLNEAGFNDVARLSSAPLVATHSNVHTLCQSSRNLTTRQLEVIAASGGLVGVNFAVAFLRPDGKHNADMPLEVIIRHIDMMLTILGEKGVALGSDFDGAQTPRALANASCIQTLIEAMRKAGYGETLIRRLCRDNWIEMIEHCIG